MSDLLDKLAQGAGPAMSEVKKEGGLQSFVSGIRQRLAEADRKRKVTLVKQEIGELQKQEAQAISALSAQVLALHEAGTLTQPELVSLCRNRDDVRKQIHDLEAELAQLQPPPAVAPAAAPVAAGAAPVVQPSPAAASPVAQARCPRCGAVVVAGADFCGACGARLTADRVPPPALFCIHCGAQLREGARFCPKCGQVVA